MKNGITSSEHKMEVETETCTIEFWLQATRTPEGHRYTDDELRARAQAMAHEWAADAMTEGEENRTVRVAWTGGRIEELCRVHPALAAALAPQKLQHATPRWGIRITPETRALLARVLDRAMSH